MNQFLQELITILGGFAIFAAALAWLIKSIITHFLNKDIEKYKSRLSAEAIRELEQLKSQLQIIVKENEIRFSKLHEKRAEVISELYLLIIEADLAVSNLDISLQYKDSKNINEQTIEERANKARRKCVHAFEFFDKHRLYFSESVEKLIQGVIFAMSEPSAAFSPAYYRISNDVEQQTKILEKWRQESSNISEIKRTIEKEFRIMLGSDSHEIELIRRAEVDK